MRLMIHTIRPGDVLTMVGPDGSSSEIFTLAETPGLRQDTVWIYREYDAPIVVARTYGLDSHFWLHSRREQGLPAVRTLPEPPPPALPEDSNSGGRHRANP